MIIFHVPLLGDLLESGAYTSDGSLVLLQRSLGRSQLLLHFSLLRSGVRVFLEKKRVSIDGIMKAACVRA